MTARPQRQEATAMIPRPLPRRRFPLRPTVRRLALWGAMAVALAVASCAQPPVPRDAFYRLDVVPSDGGPSATPSSAPLFEGKAEVRPLGTDGVLGQRAVAFVPDGSSALEQYSYHFWAEPPADMVQRELVAHLRAAGLFEAVVTPELRVRTDYEVQGRLARFEQVLTGDVPRFIVEMELSVVRKRGLDLLTVQVYRREEAASDTTVESAAAAARRALQSIFKDFEASLRALRRRS